jgi:L-gulono-1,4-lactone dehydrogenase
VRRSWANWAGNQRCAPAAVVEPRDVDELVRAVREATARGLRVKAVGAGHSFTPIAVTDGVQLCLDSLTGIVEADAASGLVTLRAGTRLRDIPSLLEPCGLAMTNLGDIDEQSIAGAISTGTHGTGACFGGIATQVRALRLVLADGSLVTCSPDQPELFAAARVGLGALGVVATVTLQCEPAFGLHAVERPMPLEEVLEGFDELAGGSDHFEFYWFPHTDVALTKTNTRLPADAALSPLSSGRAWVDDELLTNSVYGLTCRLCQGVPALVPAVNRLAARALSARQYSDLSHRVFVTPRRVRFREMEYAIPREAGVEAVREVRRLIDRQGWRISFPIEVRVAAADDIWLSTAQGRDSVYIAVHQFHPISPDPYFRAVEKIMSEFDGRPHWGKLHYLDAPTLATRYPHFADFTALRTRLDPNGSFTNPHLDHILGPLPPP